MSENWWEAFPKLAEPLPQAEPGPADDIQQQLRAGGGPGRVPRALLQGASFGFADEAEAALRSVLGQGYDTSLEQIRGQNAAFRAQAPLLSNALEFGGGFATGLPGGKALSGALEMAPRALRYAVPGAVGGGLAGLGYSEATDAPGILGDVAQGAAGGAATGLLLEPVTRASTWTLRKLAGLPAAVSRWASETPKTKAMRTVGMVARQSDLDADTMTRAFDDLGPEAVPADTSDTMQTLGEAAANRTVAGRQAAASVVEPRQMSQQARIMQSLRVTSKQDVPVLDFLDEATELRKAAADPIYKAMREEGLNLDAVPDGRKKLAELMKRPTMRRALRTAKRKAADMGETPAVAAGPALADNRLADEGYRNALRRMADDLQVGGGVSYLKDDYGTITGRTGSTNPEWFQELGAPVAEVRSAAAKALSGAELTRRESRIVRQMLDVEDDMAGEVGGGVRDWADLDGDAPVVADLLEAKKPDDLTITDIDYVKRALDDKIRAALRKGYNDDARIWGELKGELLDLADNMNTQYKAARNAYTEWSSVMTAAQLGAKALNTDSEILSRQIAKMSDPEMEAFRLGVADAVRKRINEGGETHNTAARLLRSPELKARIGNAFPDEQSFGAFRRQLQAEATFARTRERALYGSQTARRLAIQKAVGNEAAADTLDTAGTVAQGAASLGSGNPAGILSTLLSGGAKILRKDLSEPEWRELAKLMFSQDLTTRRRIIRMLQTQRNRTARDDWLLEALRGSLRLNIGREVGRAGATLPPELLVPPEERPVTP